MRFLFPCVGTLWSPLDDYPDALLYRSDAGVTSSSTATRHRDGIPSLDIMAGATYGSYRPGPDPPADGLIATGGTLACDGQGMVELASGRFLLAGGAPAGHAYQSVNTIWYSDDRGKTWAVLLPDAAASSTRPAPGHTFGFFTWTISGAEYVYWLGGDPFTPTGDVFRSADGGSTWTRISTTCPTSGLALYMYGVLNNVVYVIGGQVDILDGAASKTVHKSTDYGATWTTLSSGFNCPADVWGDQLGPLPVKDGKLWVCGSGRYDSTVNDFSNGVFTFDGTTWTEVLANGHAQFLPSRYHSCVLYKDKLWRINGTTWDGATKVGDTKTAYYSSDGVTWTALSDEIFLTWQNTHAQAAIATSDGIYFTDGFESANLNVIREHTGEIVSAWADQGSNGLDLTQATAGKKPILDLTAFASRPGVVFTKSQFLALAAPFRDLADGHYEVYFVGKLLDLDASAAQGPNAPGTVVGASNGSSWNNAGFDDGLLCYREYTAGYNAHVFGSTKLNDDVAHLFGFRHESGSIRAYVGTTQQGATVTTSTFDTSFTGFDGLGAGYLEADYAAIVLGAVIVIAPAAASDAGFLSRLNTWAQGWI